MTNNAQEANQMPAPWDGLLTPSQWAVLDAGLSSDIQQTLLQTLQACEEPLVRERLVSEVVDAVEEYGERAFIVGLTRAMNPPTPPASGVRGSL